VLLGISPRSSLPTPIAFRGRGLFGAQSDRRLYPGHAPRRCMDSKRTALGASTPAPADSIAVRPSAARVVSRGPLRTGGAAQRRPKGEAAWCQSPNSARDRARRSTPTGDGQPRMPPAKLATPSTHTLALVHRPKAQCATRTAGLPSDRPSPPCVQGSKGQQALRPSKVTRRRQS
jgi:hypothetical protein